MGVAATTKDEKYQAGYNHGFYEPELQLEHYEHFWNKPEDFKDDVDWQMGYKDGRGDREVRGFPNAEGDFFCYNISGYPWGSNVERKIQKAGWGLSYHPKDDQLIFERPVLRPEELDHYRLKKNRRA